MYPTVPEAVRDYGIYGSWVTFPNVLYCYGFVTAQEASFNAQVGYSQCTSTALETWIMDKTCVQSVTIASIEGHPLSSYVDFS